MRLASFSVDGRTAYGAVLEGGLVDLTAVAGWPHPDLRSLLPVLTPQLRAQIEHIGAPTLPLSAVRWRPVVPNPSKIICVGLNYRDHVQETSRPIPMHPVLFPRFAASQIGHLQPLVRPRVSQQLDYEGELAVIIGRPGRHIGAERAFDHVGGYAIYNEASIRDWQRHTHQYTAGKNFAGTGAFGPWLVTADEIPDPRELTLTTRLNGEVMQHASVADLIFPIERLIAYVSTIIELEAGDVLVTGTPAGVGGTREPAVWMRPGDSVEVEISRIGILKNSVQQERDT